MQQVEIGGRRDGTIDAYRLTIVQDAGAYPEIGAALPFMSRVMTTGVYAIPKAEFNAVSVVTNTASVVAYRGAGRPEAAAAIERGIDIWAAELGIDPIEVRRRNLIAKDAFPYTTPVGTTYDVGDYEHALDLVLETAGYTALRDEQSQRRARTTCVNSASGWRCTSRSPPDRSPTRNGARSRSAPTGARSCAQVSRRTDRATTPAWR